jgi:hypothetical protein
MNEHNQLMLQYHLENVDYLVVLNHPKCTKLSTEHIHIYFKLTGARE